jgi:hypothetical protein
MAFSNVDFSPFEHREAPFLDREHDCVNYNLAYLLNLD